MDLTLKEGDMTVVLIIFIVIFFSLSLFLGKEIMKKFGFMYQFAADSKQLLTYNFPGAKKSGFKPGMRKITIRWDRHFSVLVGFHLSIPFFGKGLDYYGFARSVGGGDECWLDISTYLGNRPVEFLFFLNKEMTVKQPEIYIGDFDPRVPKSQTYPPHLWQRLGFFG